MPQQNLKKMIVSKLERCDVILKIFFINNMVKINLNEVICWWINFVWYEVLVSGNFVRCSKDSTTFKYFKKTTLIVRSCEVQRVVDRFFILCMRAFGYKTSWDSIKSTVRFLTDINVVRAWILEMNILIWILDS